MKKEYSRFDSPIDINAQEDKEMENQWKENVDSSVWYN